MELISDLCLRCGVKMIYDVYDFYKCPNCGGEFWLQDETEADKARTIQEAFQNKFVSLSFVPGKVKGGGDKGGKRKKPKKQKYYEQTAYET